MEAGLRLARENASDMFERPAVVEPVALFERCEIDGLEAAPINGFAADEACRRLCSEIEIPMGMRAADDAARATMILAIHLEAFGCIPTIADPRRTRLIGRARTELLSLSRQRPTTSWDR